MKKNWIILSIKWIGILTLFTFITGFLVDLYIRSYDLYRPRDEFLINPVYLSSFVFSLTFIVVNRTSGIWAINKFPVINWKRVGLHVFIQTGSAVAAYIIASIATAVIYWSDHQDVEQDYNLAIFIFIMSMFAAFFFNMVYYSSYLYRNLLVQKQQTAEHQLTALKNQINPHFLFNSLNSIASLIRVSPEKAEQVTEDLADLFRYSLRSGKQHVTTFSEEIESAKTYFRIEKARFGDKIDLEFNVPESIREIEMPSLVIQPLIENAVKHAAQKMTTHCLIQLFAKSYSTFIEIGVKDNGPGFSTLENDILFQKGTGLKNVNDRLHFTLGGQANLQFEKNMVKFKVPIKTRKGEV